MWKLSGAFVSNNVLMPVAVASLQSLHSQGTLVSQALYERAGFMIFEHACLLMLVGLLRC